MVTNVATALFGLADMWVIGRLGDAGAQGAVELGARFMTSLLVVFNFLRSGTTGLTAQAAGGEVRGQDAVLARAVVLALAIAGVVLALVPVMLPVGLGWLGARGEVAALAAAYAGRRCWAVPAALVNGALIGWLVGRRQVRGVLIAEVGANIAHIALDVGLVLGLGWGVAGVASASAVSEWLKLGVLAWLVMRQGWRWGGGVWQVAAFGRLLALNRDLFLRTLLLTGVMLEFTWAGARMGVVVLAANGILFQMFMLSALILDGFETAAQVLCGEACGRGDDAGFRAALRGCLRAGWLVGLAIAVLYGVAGGAIAGSFNLDPAVGRMAVAYLPWVVAVPLLGVTSFVMDGVFVGAGWVRAMLGTMVVAFAVFNGALWGLAPLGNHGVWLAFCLLLVVRAGGQILCLPGLARQRAGG